jgi:hypothetical protein
MTGGGAFYGPARAFPRTGMPGRCLTSPGAAIDLFQLVRDNSEHDQNAAQQGDQCRGSAAARHRPRSSVLVAPAGVLRRGFEGINSGPHGTRGTHDVGQANAPAGFLGRALGSEAAN